MSTKCLQKTKVKKLSELFMGESAIVSFCDLHSENISNVFYFGFVFEENSNSPGLRSMGLLLEIELCFQIAVGL